MRVAILCDYAEENWPSMDLAADMLLSGLNSAAVPGVEATRIQPAMKLRFQHWTGLSAARNVDRLFSRLWDYPGLARQLPGFDLFHVVDHSYAQLVHALVPERTVVTCHDTDTFRCVLEPDREPRPYWFKAMARHILRGLEKAASIVCVSEATRHQLLHHGVAPAERIHVVHNGVHSCFQPEPDLSADREAERLLGPAGETIEILHVGSSIPRKRIDVLLRVFTECLRTHANLRLVRVGARESAETGSSIVPLPFLKRDVLAAVYRRAAVVLIPSDAEGFGLPMAESMACGTPVLASDIPALREVGGNAADYCAVADVAAWVAEVQLLLAERSDRPDLWKTRADRARQRARIFSWDRNAQELADIYRKTLCGLN